MKPSQPQWESYSPMQSTTPFESQATQTKLVLSLIDPPPKKRLGYLISHLLTTLSSSVTFSVLGSCWVCSCRISSKQRVRREPGLISTSEPLSHSLSGPAWSNNRAVVVERRSHWSRVTERDELVGRMSASSRLPQYLTTAILTYEEGRTETLAHQVESQ